MNKLFLMKNPDLFQGKKYLNTNKNYFEGWYFKNTNNVEGISFIPGINIDEKDKKAFIQVITNNSSYFINYNIKDFKFNFEPFLIQIGNNTFSKDGIHIKIKDDTQNLNIYGDIKYLNSKNINTSLLNPNIMGPFSYIPFMECNHAILSMQNCIQGSININSFMFSIADIPFKFLNFRGIICVLLIDNNEFKFTTYNNTKLIEYDVNSNSLNITLKKGYYYLNIKSTYNEGFKLLAPIKGKMEKDIFESISSSITLTLKKDNTVIFSDTSTKCGVEIVRE